MPIYKTDRKKDGKQGYRVILNYIDNYGKYKKIERIVYGSAEAKAEETALKKEIEKAPSKKIKVKDLIDEYIFSKKNEVRETTLDKAERNISLYISPTFSELTVDKLENKLILQKWKNQIFELGLSVVTMQNIYSQLNALINYAVKMDYLQKNNLTSLGNFKDANNFDVAKDKLHYYTIEQFKKYIEVAKEKAENKDTITEWGYYVFFNIAFYCGMRKGEINALKWSDIDGNIINIRRSIAQKLKGGDRETPPKNKSSYRSIQMPKQLIEILDEHKKRQMQDTNFTDDYRVCGAIQPLRDTSIDKRNQLFAEIAELPHIRIHDFRHSHASLLVNEGINIQEVARRLGHSDIKMTLQTYSHLYPQEEERAIKVLENLEKSATKKPRMFKKLKLRK